MYTFRRKGHHTFHLVQQYSHAVRDRLTVIFEAKRIPTFFKKLGQGLSIPPTHSQLLPFYPQPFPLHFEMDDCSMVKWLRQAKNEYTPPPRPPGSTERNKPSLECCNNGFARFFKYILINSSASLPQYLPLPPPLRSRQLLPFHSTSYPPQPPAPVSNQMEHI